MKSENDFLREVSEQLNVPLKADQSEVLSAVYDFLFLGGAQSSFILRGYAGTGKTTLIGALIRWLHTVNRKTVLLAPTGRSAKVLSSHAGFPASTIHRRIYSVKEDDSGRPMIALAENKSKKTIFIVDEASMIGEGQAESGFPSRSLLEDLVSYVYSGERCRLILIGDDAQLPPVGMDVSPALDKKRFAAVTHAPVYTGVLRDVVRQAEMSWILANATLIRQQLSASQFQALRIYVSKDADSTALDAYELEDKLSQLFYGDEVNQSVIICRSNKDANAFNRQIRSRIYMRENEVEGGDRLMVVKNNYHWEIPGQRQNFLANGDMITVERVQAVHAFGSFRFAEVQVCFSDEPEISFELILMLNSLESESPSIDGRAMLKLRDEMIAAGALNEDEAYEKFFQNPFFRAVQVKYAYAVTCHKSQGGQWKNVLIYQGYFTDEMLDRTYFRWLYTAITRATTKLYLVGFHEDFLCDETPPILISDQ